MSTSSRSIETSSCSSRESSSRISTTSADDDELEYEVEKIIGKKQHQGIVYYQVKWVGHQDASWEPADKCDCAQLIGDYEKRQRQGKLDNFDEDEDEWEVEAIEGKRSHRNRTQYLVKWRGWPGAPTWEYADNCQCINLIAAYENPKLKKMWDFKGSNRNLWLKHEDMMSYMRNHLKQTNKQRRVNLLKFDPDFPRVEKQLPLMQGLNVGPLCHENHWYLVVILINHIGVTRRILVGDSLNTLIGTNADAHPVIKRLKKVYTHFSIKPFTMTQMDRSDVCAYYTLAAFERSLFLYDSSLSLVSENIFFKAPRAELIRHRLKPETDGEISAGLPIPSQFFHGPKCELCEDLFDTQECVDEHIKRRHMMKRTKAT